MMRKKPDIYMIKEGMIPVSLKRYEKKMDFEYEIWKEQDNRVCYSLYTDDNDNPYGKTRFSFDFVFSFDEIAGFCYREIFQHILGERYDLFGKHKKEKQYAYLRANWLTKQIYFLIYRVVKREYDITEEEITKIRRFTWRNTLNGTHTTPIALRLKIDSEKEYGYFMNDMFKYPSGMCNYLLFKLSLHNQDNYSEVVSKIPKIIRNCCIPKTISPYYLNNLNMMGVKPKGRLQWDWVNIMERCCNEDYVNANWFNIHYSDVKWFKEQFNIEEKTYNYDLLTLIKDTLMDGYRINSRFSDMYEDIPIKEVSGSFIRMLKASVYNHNQHRKITRRQLSEKPNWKMPEPPVKLPDWIENIRIKTAHEMLQAGQDCRHCIGSYTDSKDIFVREGDLCAQIYRERLDVGQCYDMDDKTTESSENLRMRLTQSLQKLREELKASSPLFSSE